MHVNLVCFRDCEETLRTCISTVSVSLSENGPKLVLGGSGNAGCDWSEG